MDTVGTKHIGARARRDQPVGRIGPVQPSVLFSKGQSGVLEVT